MADDYQNQDDRYRDNPTQYGPYLEHEHRIPCVYGPPPVTGYQYDATYDEGEYELEECEPIHGWLIFFLFVFVGLGSVVSLAMDLYDYDFSNPWIITAGVIISDLAYLATGVFTIVAFYKRQPDAVHLARIFIIACFIINLGALMLNNDGLSANEVTTAIKSIVWCGVWFIFTFASQQIQERIPHYWRRFKVRDFVLAALILLPLIGIVSYAQVIQHQQETNAVIDAKMLTATTEVMDENQRTDGRILITLPDGVDCESETHDDGITVFSVNNIEQGTYGNIVSEHDNSIDNASVEDIYQNWMPNDASSYTTNLIVDNQYKKDGKTIWSKKLKFETDDNPVYWDFTVVADGKSDKFFVIATYSLLEDDPTWNKLLDSIVFL